MKLSLSGTKWSIEPIFGFRFLEEQTVLVATLARHDIGDLPAKRGTYQLFDGDLYFLRSSVDPKEHHNWWFYDVSVRRWSKCDDPTKASM